MANFKLIVEKNKTYEDKNTKVVKKYDTYSVVDESLEIKIPVPLPKDNVSARNLYKQYLEDNADVVIDHDNDEDNESSKL